MDNCTYSFNAFNDCAKYGIGDALAKFNVNNLKPIVVCVGSDLVLGDCLGPLVGTFLKAKRLNSYVYGTLNSPVTAKDVDYASTYLKRLHNSSLVISVDAAVGASDDVGVIKVINRGLKPGLGVNKNLNPIGDVSVIGIVAEKTKNNYNLFNFTRLNLVYKMAQVISIGIENFINDFMKATSDKQINLSNERIIVL